MAKVNGAKHYDSKMISCYENGGKVASAQAMGRARSGQRAQNEANAKMSSALLGSALADNSGGSYLRVGGKSAKGDTALRYADTLAQSDKQGRR